MPEIMHRVNLRITKNQHAYIRSVAKEKDISDNQVVRNVIQEQIEKSKKKKQK